MGAEERVALDREIRERIAARLATASVSREEVAFLLTRMLPEVVGRLDAHGHVEAAYDLVEGSSSMVRVVDLLLARFPRLVAGVLERLPLALRDGLLGLDVSGEAAEAVRGVVASVSDDDVEPVTDAGLALFDAVNGALDAFMGAVSDDVKAEVVGAIVRAKVGARN